MSDHAYFMAKYIQAHAALKLALDHVNEAVRHLDGTHYELTARAVHSRIDDLLMDIHEEACAHQHASREPL